MLEMDLVWGQVVSNFRRVCLLKRQGRLEDAEALLAGLLTERIAQWSQETKQDAVSKRQSLHDMFVAEESRVEEAWQIQQIILGEIRASVATEIRAQIHEEVRAAVAALPLPAPVVPAPPIEIEPPIALNACPLPEPEPEISVSSIQSVSDVESEEALEAATVFESRNTPSMQPISPSQRGPSADDLASVIDFILAQQSGARFAHHTLAAA